MRQNEVLNIFGILCVYKLFINCLCGFIYNFSVIIVSHSQTTIFEMWMIVDPLQKSAMDTQWPEFGQKTEFVVK